MPKLQKGPFKGENYLTSSKGLGISSTVSPFFMETRPAADASPSAIQFDYRVDLGAGQCLEHRAARIGRLSLFTEFSRIH